MSSAALQFSSADEVAWALSKPSKKPMDFVREKINWYQALNQGPYIQQPCNFHKTAGGEVLDFSRAEVAMPYVIQATQQGVAVGSVTATCTLSSPMFIGLKPGGTLNCVDKVVFQINGSTLGNQQNLSPVYAKLKYIFGTCEAYHKIMGPKYLMGNRLPVDEVLNYQNTANGGFTAITTVNCNVTTSPTTGLKPQDSYLLTFLHGPLGCNKALYSRCINLGQPQTRDPTTPNANILDSVQANRVNACMTVAGAANGNAIVAGTAGVWLTGYMVIPLAKICDVFRGLGIRTWVDFNLALYMNSCYNVSVVAGGAGATNTGYSAAQSYVPFMISQAGASTYVAGNVQNGISPAGNILSASCIFGAYNTTLYTAGAYTAPNSGSYAELWIPEYQLDADEMSEFLSSPRSTLGFFDYFYINNYINVTSGGMRNDSLNGVLTCPRKIYMLVYPAVANLTNIVPLDATPTSYEPLYSTANIQIGHMNVKVNGVPIYPLNIEYQYQDWINNTQENLLLNAGLVPQLAGSLVTKDFWDCAKVYVMDLSRYTLPATPVPIIVNYTNLSGITIDVRYFVESYYEGLVEQAPNSFKVEQMPAEV